MTGRLLDYAAPVLRAARNHASLSQAEIAQRAGVSDATISRMETGKAWPSGTNVESVIDAYATATGLSEPNFWSASFSPGATTSAEVCGRARKQLLAWGAPLEPALAVVDKAVGRDVIE